MKDLAATLRSAPRRKVTRTCSRPRDYDDPRQNFCFGAEPENPTDPRIYVDLVRPGGGSGSYGYQVHLYHGPVHKALDPVTSDYTNVDVRTDYCHLSESGRVTGRIQQGTTVGLANETGSIHVQYRIRRFPLRCTGAPVWERRYERSAYDVHLHFMVVERAEGETEGHPVNPHAWIGYPAPPP